MGGASGLQVSRLGHGTSTWGGVTPEEDTATILRNFIDAGGTLIDASPAYAGGRAEGILGTLLSREVSRTDLVISSAAGVDPTLPLGRRVDCSRRHLIASLDNTLSVLGTDYLDLWSVGFWDGKTPPEEVADTLDYAVRTGRVRYTGVRGYSGWQLAVTHAAANHAAGRPVLVRIRDVRQIEAALQAEADILYLGGELMANRALQDEIGRLNTPLVLCKDKHHSTDEWLTAAEHIALKGNHQIILGESGTLSFSPRHPHRLDTDALVRARRLCRLPVLANITRLHHSDMPQEILRKLAEAAGANAVVHTLNTSIR